MSLTWLSGKDLLEALCCILRVPSGYVHLPQAKVREDVATGGKLCCLVVVLECLVIVTLQMMHVRLL